MAGRRTRTFLLSAIPLLLLLLPMGVYAADRSGHEVPRNVSVAGVDLGGLNRDEAVAALRAREAELRDRTITVRIGDTTFPLRPGDVGFRLDLEAAVDEALRQRPAEGLVEGFATWLRSFSDPIEVPVSATVDADALDAVLDGWEEQAGLDIPYDGDLRIVDGEVVVDPPRPGEQVDRGAAAGLVAAAALDPGEPSVDLPVTDRDPDLTMADFEEAQVTVRRILDGPVTLTNAELDYRFVFQPEDIRAGLRAGVDPGPPARIDISIDPAVVASVVGPSREEFELPPVNASYEVDTDTDTVTIVPGRPATIFDPDAVAEELVTAAARNDYGDFPVAYGDEPEVSTADLEAYGPLTLISEFTTKHKCCQPRVKNIHLMADIIDGTVVWPGEKFSVNETVGIRTEEKGFVRDGAIIDGEVYCCDSPANVGGGVSQYGTTIYNAIFFACLEDVEHTPHSLYISRYPLGREATLGWPHPDVVFRNDTDFPVIIKNTYTDTTITVKFYGNKEGRNCYPEKDPPDRYNFTPPPEKYEPNPELAPGEQHVEKTGSSGFTTTVVRVIEYPDGTVKREPFTHRYRGYPKKIQVHPCDMPDAEEECPVAVPSVVGLDEATATATLTGVGFSVTVGYVEDAGNVGLVISQTPAGGSYADAGSTVTIVVGTAPGGGGGDGGGGG